MLGGMLSAIKFAHTKNPRPAHRHQLRHVRPGRHGGIIRCILWPERVRRRSANWSSPTRSWSSAARSTSGRGSEEANLIVNELIPLDQLDSRYTRGLIICLERTATRTPSTLKRIHEIVRGYPGDRELHLPVGAPRRQPRAAEVAAAAGRHQARAAQPAGRPAGPRPSPHDHRPAEALRPRQQRQRPPPRRQRPAELAANRSATACEQAVPHAGVARPTCRPWGAAQPRPPLPASRAARRCGTAYLLAVGSGNNRLPLLASKRAARRCGTANLLAVGSGNNRDHRSPASTCRTAGVARPTCWPWGAAKPLPLLASKPCPTAGVARPTCWPWERRRHGHWWPASRAARRCGTAYLLAVGAAWHGPLLASRPCRTPVWHGLLVGRGSGDTAHCLPASVPHAGVARPTCWPWERHCPRPRWPASRAARRCGTAYWLAVGARDGGKGSPAGTCPRRCGTANWLAVGSGTGRVSRSPASTCPRRCGTAYLLAVGSGNGTGQLLAGSTCRTPVWHGHLLAVGASSTRLGTG